MPIGERLERARDAARRGRPAACPPLRRPCPLPAVRRPRFAARCSPRCAPRAAARTSTSMAARRSGDVADRPRDRRRPQGFEVDWLDKEARRARAGRIPRAGRAQLPGNMTACPIRRAVRERRATPPPATPATPAARSPPRAAAARSTATSSSSPDRPIQRRGGRADLLRPLRPRRRHRGVRRSAPSCARIEDKILAVARPRRRPRAAAAAAGRADLSARPLPRAVRARDQPRGALRRLSDAVPRPATSSPRR